MSFAPKPLNLGLVDAFLPDSTINFYVGSAEQFLEVCSAEGRL